MYATVLQDIMNTDMTDIFDLQKGLFTYLLDPGLELSEISDPSLLGSPQLGSLHAITEGSTSRGDRNGTSN
jgi:hypothetical protein